MYNFRSWVNSELAIVVEEKKKRKGKVDNDWELLYIIYYNFVVGKLKLPKFIWSVSFFPTVAISSVLLWVVTWKYSYVSLLCNTLTSLLFLYLVLHNPNHRVLPNVYHQQLFDGKIDIPSLILIPKFPISIFIIKRFNVN